MKNKDKEMRGKNERNFEIIKNNNNFITYIWTLYYL